MGADNSVELNNIDLYEILGVEKNASLKDIKDAYRKKDKKLHSDKTNFIELEMDTKLTEDDLVQNELKLKQLNEAYKILSDPDKRRDYDQKYAANHEELKKNYEEMLEEDNPTDYITEDDPRYINIDEFNRKFEEKREKENDPNEFGYGEYGKDLHARTEKEEYDPDDIDKPTCMFGENEQFDINKFNQAFEHFNEPKSFMSTELEPVGSNTNLEQTMGASVSTYSGLMIVGDESIGSGANYTDYKSGFTGISNPVEFESVDYSRNMNKDTGKINKNDFAKRLQEMQNERESFTKELDNKDKLNKVEFENKLIQEQRNNDKHIIESIENNKDYVKKFANQYPEHLIQAAFPSLNE